MRMVNLLGMLVALAVAMGVCAGCETRPSAASGSTMQSAAEEEHTLPEGTTIAMVVHGMGCPLCAHNVDKQLKRLDGVTEVDVDLGSGRVIAHLDGETRPAADAVINAVNESGFTFVRFDDE